MNEAPSEAMNQVRYRQALWMLLLFFAGANVLPVFPQAFPPTLYAALQILPAMLFALLHGAMAYRLPGILGFALVSLLVGYGMENMGVHTGFPFGRYHFTNGMGPKLFAVPLLMGPAYLGMGYVSWTMARVILAFRSGNHELAGARAVLLPLAASFIMVAWDLSFDPALSTFGRYWVWEQGGAYFGVPVSNFLGWFLTNYLIYQFFVLYQRRRPVNAVPLRPVDARLAVIFYTVCAAGCVLRAASTASPAVVADSTGVLWRVRNINNVCALSALFIMGGFVTFACAKLAERAGDGLRWKACQRRGHPEIAVSEEDEIQQTR